MHAHAGAFAHCIQSIDHFTLVVRILGDDLPVDIGRDATHLVMDGGNYRDGFFGDVNVGKVMPDLEHGWQTLHDVSHADVCHVEIDVVLVGTTTTAFLDFLVHAA